MRGAITLTSHLRADPQPVTVHVGRRAVRRPVGEVDDLFGEGGRLRSAGDEVGAPELTLLAQALMHGDAVRHPRRAPGTADAQQGLAFGKPVQDGFHDLRRQFRAPMTVPGHAGRP